MYVGGVIGTIEVDHTFTKLQEPLLVKITLWIDK
jgi:hypothetical protein